MLGNHEGITPLEDPIEIVKPALVALGRIGAGKDVAQRRQVLQRAAAQIATDDRYWPETMASRLADQGIEAGQAHLAALIAATQLRETETARLLRYANSVALEGFSKTLVEGLVAIDDGFAQRVRKAQVDSDELFIRVAIAHFFRRNPESVFQVMMVHSLAKKLPKAFKGGVGGLTEWALNRMDEEAAPAEAWGYLLVLRDMRGKNGFYLPDPELGRPQLDRMLEQLAPMMPDATEEAKLHACAAAMFEGAYLKGDAGTFGAMMAAILDRMGSRHAVFHAREGEEGYHISIHEIPAATVEEARRVGRQLPEVRMHDDFRRMTEFLAQVAEGGLDAPTP